MADNSVIAIQGKGIAWPDDINYKFKNADLTKQWIDVTDERFITWMKISPFSDFRKSWGIITKDLSKGSYQINIKNNWNSSLFLGQKWIILS